MIAVTVRRNQQGQIEGFTVQGHAGYAQRGYDIVCAAVSALTQTAVWGLRERAGLPLQVEVREGWLFCQLPPHLGREERLKADLLLETMLDGLQQVAQLHPDRLSIAGVKAGERP